MLAAKTNSPMRSLVIFSLVLLFLSGCNAEMRKARRAERLIQKACRVYPPACAEDSVKAEFMVVTDSISADSTFPDSARVVIIEKERLRMVYQRDTLTNTVYLWGECRSDTIRETKYIPYQRLHPRPTELVEEDNSWPWWAWLILAALLVALVWGLKKLIRG